MIWSNGLSKLDASLISAKERSEAPASSKYSVFVRTDPAAASSEQASLPQELRDAYTAGQTVVTAYLSKSQIEQLSDLPAVQSIRLAQKLRTMLSE